MTAPRAATPRGAAGSRRGSPGTVRFNAEEPAELIDLVQWVWEEFRVSGSQRTLSREPLALGYRKLSVYPRHHARDPDTLKQLKKLPRHAGGDRRGSGARAERIKLWFQDEMRDGQKNPITRRWARRGTRPAAPKDQRARSAYIFGAIYLA
jgi:hypothetical protein